MADDPRVVRTIHASHQEIIEVRWVRRWWDESQGWQEQHLVQRYTAPPWETWKARTREERREEPPPPVVTSQD